MRAYRKRSWAAMAVNLTPLIDVVFLIIIFFIIMINFSEMHIRKINLPKADEAKDSLVDKNFILPVIVKSEDLLYLDRTRITLESLADGIREKRRTRAMFTVQVMADEAVPYAVIKKVLNQLSSAGIGRIEFSTVKDAPEPLQEEVGNEK